MFDTQLILKDEGLVAASAAAQVDAEDQILNIGEGIVKGFMVVDLNAVEIADDDELYLIELQGSNQDDFSDNIVCLAVLKVGALEVTGDSEDTTAGEFRIPFCNQIKKAGRAHPYVRAYTRVSGTIATGINYSAWIEDPVNMP